MLGGFVDSLEMWNLWVFLCTFGCLISSSGVLANVVLTGNSVTLSFPDIAANFARPVNGSGEHGTLFLASPLDACSPLAKANSSIEDGINPPYVLIIRGGCHFADKVQRAQDAGFKAAIIYNNQDTNLVAMAGNSAGIHIHAVFVSEKTGLKLRKYVGRTEIQVWLMLDWIRPLRGGATVMEADEIVRLVGLYVFGNGKDTWAWSLEGMDDFVVKGVRSTIEESLSPSSSFTRWIKWVPRKVNIHAWRTLLDHLPTRVSLSNKGLDIPSTLCPMCNNETESLAHVFAFCSIACKVWSSISRWLNVGFLDCCSPQDLMYKVDDLHLPIKKKLVIEGIIYSAWWVIWRHQNDEVFSAKKHRFVCLFDSIVHFSFIWYSNRVSKSRISWDEWILNPLLFL